MRAAPPGVRLSARGALGLMDGRSSPRAASATASPRSGSTAIRGVHVYRRQPAGRGHRQERLPDRAGPARLRSQHDPDRGGRPAARRQPRQHEIDVRPFARAGTSVSFAARRERGVLMHVRLEDGSDLPAGALVRVEGAAETFVAVSGGEVYVPELRGVVRMRASWGVTDMRVHRVGARRRRSPAAPRRSRLPGGAALCRALAHLARRRGAAGGAVGGRRPARSARSASPSAPIIRRARPTTTITARSTSPARPAVTAPIVALNGGLWGAVNARKLKNGAFFINYNLYTPPRATSSGATARRHGHPDPQRRHALGRHPQLLAHHLRPGARQPECRRRRLQRHDHPYRHLLGSGSAVLRPSPFSSPASAASIVGDVDLPHLHHRLHRPLAAVRSGSSISSSSRAGTICHERPSGP